MQGFEKVLIIGKVWPEPKSSAAGARMMQLLDFFISKNCEVTFASTANESPFQEDLSNLNIRTQTIQLNDNSFDDFLSTIEPTAVVFDRFMTEEQFGWRVMEQFPDAIRILNSEDLHGLRYARQESIKIDGTLNNVDLFNDKMAREVASIYRSDIALMVSEVEIELLEQQFGIPNHKLVYLPLFAGEMIEESMSYNDRKGFLFIGNYWHEPNWDALRYLKITIWPLIRASMKDAVIHVYGAYAGQKVMDFHSERDGFLVHGRTEDALEVTMNARISLVSLRYGAGIKGKVMEAMQVGTPVVTTDVGAESMTVDHRINGTIANDPAEFAKAAIELYQSEEKWLKAQSIGYEIVSTKFNASTYSPSFELNLSDLAQNIKEHRKKDFTSFLIQQQSLLSTKYLSKWIEEKNK